ncbi:hypothetical protein [Nannocystis pusilla]|uniref:hypothetical protein n=1 Tax=Nannocystis pusilla TaxID=889268 RepID=UPI003B768ABC
MTEPRLRPRGEALVGGVEHAGEVEGDRREQAEPRVERIDACQHPVGLLARVRGVVEVGEHVEPGEAQQHARVVVAGGVGLGAGLPARAARVARCAGVGSRTLPSGAIMLRCCARLRGSQVSR